jgi:hypothetical protein
MSTIDSVDSMALKDMLRTLTARRSVAEFLPSQALR